MSTGTAGQIGSYGTEPATGYGGYTDAEPGYGWVLFAGTMLAMVGTLNIIEGIAAVANSHFFVNDAHYVVGSLNTWGWVVMVLGLLQIAVGIGIWVKNQFARWVGVLVAVVSAIAQLLFIPAYPFWSLSMFALDVLIIYGLVAHGGRTRSVTA